MGNCRSHKLRVKTASRYKGYTMRVRMTGLRGPRYLTEVKLSGVTAPDRKGERRRFVCVANTGAMRLAVPEGNTQRGTPVLCRAYIRCPMVPSPPDIMTQSYKAAS